MYKTIKRIRNGGGRLEDLDILLNAANNLGIIPGTTICGLSDGAAWPIKNAINKYRAELEDFIRTHQTPGRGLTTLQESIAQGVRVVPAASGLTVLGSTRPSSLNAPAS